MAVNGVGGNDVNFLEKVVAQVENLFAEGEKLAENLFGQNAETDSTAAQALRQRDVQMRDRLESSLNGSSAPLSANQFKAETSHNTGAIYRKVTTNQSADTLGLRSEGGTIPAVVTDSKRFRFPGNDNSDRARYREMTERLSAGKLTGPLDRASIYMGGRGNVDKKNPAKGIEIDAGLAWSRTFKNVPGLTGGPQAMWTTDKSGSSRADQFAVQLKGNQYIVHDSSGKEVARGLEFKPKEDGSVTIGDKTLRPNFGFRPFFRSTDKQGENAGYAKDYVSAGNAFDREFYAGDKFSMSMTMHPTIKDKVTFAVSGVESGGKEIKESSYSPTVAGFSKGVREFKRVDSVDQKGREGRDGHQYVDGKRIKGGGTYQGTQTTVTNGSWGATSVLKKDGEKPFIGSEGTTQRSVEFKNDYDSIFGSTGKGRATRTDGSEQIYINPPNVHKPIAK